ncbi:hypothetical protein NOI24_16255 [Neorhizobium galegae]|uniref:hypothetical protein n=1 Tax=Neorhizobium galegae TaxID=399 RepID=UPI0021083A3B|nr:hypothetical protein [Neorhizobium galegae]MCQ1772863.1 hypothetical protein [Neorhizobium galegae]MCQ1799190.1 hypothetical protein [Neorhizobium galegae]
MEDWEIELCEAARTNLEFHREVLDFIATGEPVIHADFGDITEGEFRKSTWWVAHYSSLLARLELDVANDNEPPMDEELADLIQGDW